MAHLAGKAGAVYSTTTGGTATQTVIVTGMKSWSVDYTIDALETTDFADVGVKSYIAGLSGWSGSFEGYKDGAPGLVVGTSYVLHLNESATTTQRYTGTALITGLHGAASNDGIVTVGFDFQGTGTLTVPTA
jgi:hypothetical protein